MLTPKRWQAERLVMKETFPYLEPFENGDKIGFQGYLRLARRGTYEIVVEASASRYPMEEPRVYLNPHPEEHCWIRTGGQQPYLSFERTKAWSPAGSTFASVVAVAIKSL